MLLDSGCVVCGLGRGPVCDGCSDGLTASGSMTVPGLDSCRNRFVLDDHSRPIIAAFKYRRQRRIARWLALELAMLVPRCADLITWVPATPERRRSRGFDQAQQLAVALGHITGVPTAQLLRRDRTDERQTGRTRNERLAGPLLSGEPAPVALLVIVDDVITTGSSMRAAALALRRATSQLHDTPERQRIIGVTAAATPDHRDVCLHDLTNRSSIRKWT